MACLRRPLAKFKARPLAAIHHPSIQQDSSTHLATMDAGPAGTANAAAKETADDREIADERANLANKTTSEPEPAAKPAAKPKKKKGGSKVTGKDLVGLGEKRRGAGHTGGGLGVRSLGACSIQ